MESLTIFFPFLNDAKTVEPLISQAYRVGKQLTPDLEVIAIHGGASRDNTLEEILKAKQKYPSLVVLDHSSNQEGYAVIRHGFEAATKEWVFYTDGDGQYDLEDLRKLAEKAGQYDVVNGYKEQRGDQWHRKWLGRGYQLFSQLLFRLPIRDVDCDFRLIRRNRLQNVRWISRGASILPELILHLKSSGATFSEVSVRHYTRSYGRSNYTPWGLFAEKLIGDLKLFLIFEEMRNTEEKLWWYVDLRERIYFELQKLTDPFICDVGCGTGHITYFLEQKGFRVEGVDRSPIALKHCLQKGLKGVKEGSVTQLPFPDETFDLVLAIDVICMLEEEERGVAIKELKRVLKPGGQLILHEPAFQWLASQHDLSCQVKKRWTQNECVRWLSEHGFQMERETYRVCFFFPLIAIVRLIKKWMMLFKSSPTSDLRMPPSLLNRFLLAIQRAESALTQRGWRMPFGLSFLLIARKNRLKTQ